MPPQVLGAFPRNHSQRASQNAAYPLTAWSSANTCLTCSCPASRANLSVTYAHVAAHPQVQVGRLTSRLPSFSCRTVMLWVTLVMVPLPPEEFLHSLGRPRLLWCRAYGDNNEEHPTGHCLAARAHCAPVKQPAENRIHLDLSTHSNGSVSPALVIGVSTAQAAS